MCRLLCVGILVVLALYIAGCGGGGGSTPPPPSGNFVVSGYVYIDGTTTPVQGAVVTIATKSYTTGSDGRFTLSFDSRPSVITFSVNLAGTTPETHTTYVRMDSQDGNGLRIQYANSITFPILPATGGIIGPIYAFDATLPPPPPP